MEPRTEKGAGPRTGKGAGRRIEKRAGRRIGSDALAGTAPLLLGPLAGKATSEECENSYARQLRFSPGIG